MLIQSLSGPIDIRSQSLCRSCLPSFSLVGQRHSYEAAVAQASGLFFSGRVAFIRVVCVCGHRKYIFDFSRVHMLSCLVGLHTEDLLALVTISAGRPDRRAIAYADGSLCGGGVAPKVTPGRVAVQPWRDDVVAARSPTFSLPANRPPRSAMCVHASSHMGPARRQSQHGARPPPASFCAVANGPRPQLFARWPRRAECSAALSLLQVASPIKVATVGQDLATAVMISAATSQIPSSTVNGGALVRQR